MQDNDTMDCDETLQRAKSAIDTADLAPLIEQLIQRNHWTRREAEEAVLQYRKFMYIVRKYGKLVALPPSVEIDEVWHAHILHTEAYCEFCQAAFGRYVHHEPGSKGKGSAAEYDLQFEENTQRLFRQEFGDSIHAIRNHAAVVMAALLKTAGAATSR